MFSGHTKTFDVRTVRWQQLHGPINWLWRHIFFFLFHITDFTLEIPNPSTLLFAEKSVRVTVWFDFCGHFTNLLYSHYSIAADVDTEDNAKSTSDYTVDLEFDQVIGVDWVD